MPNNFRASTSTAPEAREIEVSGQIKVEITRTSRTFSAPAVVRLQVKQPGGEFVELCKVRIGDVGRERNRYWLARGLPFAGPVTLRVEVTDLGSGGPTGDEPYTLEVWVASSTSPTVGRSRRETNPNVSPAADKSLCELVTHPKRPEAKLEVVHSRTIGRESREWLRLDYATAGRNIYLQFEPLGGGGAPPSVTAKLFRKRANFAFDNICSKAIDPRQAEGRMLLAASPTMYGGGRQEWRIELSGNGFAKGGRQARGLKVTVLRDVDKDADLNAQTGFDLGASVYVCHGTSGRRTMPRTGVGAFAQAPLLRLQIVADKEVVPLPVRERLAPHALRALEVWRNACRQCRPENLLFVEVNEQLYWLPESATLQKGDEKNKSDFFDARNLRGSQGTYEKVKRSDKRVQNICLVPETTASTGILAVQRMLRCGASKEDAPEPAPKMRLTLKPKKTACGEDPNIVACEADYELIELNLLDYSFRTLDADAPLIGQGERTVDLFHVMLHEVGHWLGMGHIDKGGDSLMGSTMNTSRCIDSVTADAIGAPPVPTVSESRVNAFRFANKP